MAEEDIKSVAQEKTSPNASRHSAKSDVFEKDYLAKLHDSANVPDQVHKDNEKDVEASALQRGVRVTGDIEHKTTPVDDQNVLIAYSAPAERNTL